MRPAFIAGIVIGIIMVIFGYMGASILAGIPGFELPGSYFRDDFNYQTVDAMLPAQDPTDSAWHLNSGATKATLSIANGLLSMSPEAAIIHSASTIEASTNASFEVNVCLKSSSTKFSFGIYWKAKQFVMAVDVTATGFNVYGDHQGSKLSPISSPHIVGTYYTVRIDGLVEPASNPNYALYENGVSKATNIPMLIAYSGTTNIALRSVASGGLCIIDYVEMGFLGNSPPPGNDPPKVSVLVRKGDGAVSSGTTVIVYTGSSYTTEDRRGVTDSYGFVNWTMTADTDYRFYIDSNTYADRTFSDNDVATVTLTLGQVTPDENPIVTLLNDPTVKMILMYGGGALAGLSCIGFVIPKGKRNGYSSPPQRYRY